MPAKQRDPSFDILKGIGIILVVVGHRYDINANLYQAIYSVHMPLFFLVAGCFLRPNSSLCDNFRKDVNRLVVPYFAIMPVLAAYTLLVHGVLRPDYQQFRGIPEAVFFNSTPVWFLLALFWAKQVCNFALTRVPRPLLVLCIVSLFVTFFSKPLHISSFLSIRQGLSAILFVVAGYEYRCYAERCDKYKSAIWLVSLVVWLLAISYSETSMVGCHYRLFPLAVVGACCGTYVLLYTSRCVAGRWPDTRVVRFVEWYGAGSLVVLCAHTVERYIGVWRFLHIESPWIIIPLQIALYAAALAVVHRVAWLRRLFGLQH